LLKLGVTVSERTVSRYLPDRLMAPSQTWRTFLANHLGDLAFTSTVTSSYAPDDDDDVDACVLPFRSAQSRHGPCTSTQWAVVDWPPSLQRTSLGGVSPGSPSPPDTHTRQLQQGPAEVEGRRNWPQRVRASFLPSGDSIWPKAKMNSLRPLARWPLDRHRQFCLSQCNQVVNVVGGPIPARGARPRVILTTVGILARHRPRFRRPRLR
jgi:hypothetical protein